METNNKPAWLETLWNVNPRLAEAAEKDVARWQKLETSQEKALHKHGVNGCALSKKPTRYRCLLCGRDKFTRKSPHNCKGGFRKRNIQWQPIFD